MSDISSVRPLTAGELRVLHVQATDPAHNITRLLHMLDAADRTIAGLTADLALYREGTLKVPAQVIRELRRRLAESDRRREEYRAEWEASQSARDSALEALRWYADPVNWCDGYAPGPEAICCEHAHADVDGGPPFAPDAYCDAGDRARAALSTTSPEPPFIDQILAILRPLFDALGDVQARQGEPVIELVKRTVQEAVGRLGKWAPGDSRARDASNEEHDVKKTRSVEAAFGELGRLYGGEWTVRGLSVFLLECSFRRRPEAKEPDETTRRLGREDIDRAMREAFGIYR